MKFKVNSYYIPVIACLSLSHFFFLSLSSLHHIYIYLYIYIGNIETAAYMLEFDSTHGRYSKSVTATETGHIHMYIYIFTTYVPHS